jgi:Mrp family chromosome partitioning ATPase
MSRNFDLLTRIEAELNATPDPKPSFTDSPSMLEAAPDNCAVTSGQDETLRLVQRVFLSANGSAPRRVVFCGVDGNNGSTSICADAARALATSISRPVCLLEANLKSPRLAGVLRIADTIPIFGTTASARAGCVQIGINLWFGASSVLSDKGGVLASVNEVRDRLASLREIFEFVLIDAPAANVCEDALILGQLADAAILVIEANHTRRVAAKRAMERLEESQVKLLGTVLNNRLFPIPEKIYKKL